MRITKLETRFIKPRWSIVKIHTDEGIVGIGEPTLEGRCQTIAAAIQEIGRYLVGQDPRRIEHHWQAIYRGQFYRGGPILCSALSGIEQALWDITGKWLNQPVHQLLGGATRDKIRVYGWLHGETFGDYVASAKTGVARGFTAFKTGINGPANIVDSLAWVEENANRFAAIREAVGPQVDVGIDFHGRLSPAMAIRMAKALEPYYPMFIEEPVLPENADALVTVARSTSIPIATGERLFTKWGFREVLEKQAAVILQPDISHAGGILECKKIAAMAECYYAAVAPHCPLGPVALAACLQLDACIPNFLVQEHVTLGDGYLKKPFEIVDGYIAVPQGPGLGIELDEDALADKAYDGSWETPRLWHGDGSVADW
ncbi:MAG: galactonate dehydratase [Anaerolineae bacterium]|jgi:galactonate dehydratase|nr:galactonate dehydratase [Anaerolineae bacterium]